MSIRIMEWVGKNKFIEMESLVNRILLSELLTYKKNDWNQRRADEEHAPLAIEYDSSVNSVDFSDFSFRNVTMPGGVYASCNFAGADFTEANLSGSHWVRCDFHDAVFLRCTFTDAAILGGNGSGARFDQAQLANTRFERLPPEMCVDDEDPQINLTMASFELAQAEESGFVGCLFAYAECRGMKAPESEFIACDLTGVKFGMSECDGVSGIEALADFRRVTFDEMCSLDDIDFEGADLTGASFACRNLQGMNFRDSVLREVDMQLCRFDNTEFENADLYAADLGGADLRKAQGLRVSRSFCRNARMPVDQPDQWSILRGEYTGSRLVFTLIFFSLFLLPYVLKATGLVILNRTQEIVLEHVELSEHGQFVYRLQGDQEEIQDAWPVPGMHQKRIGGILIGADKGWWYSVLVIIPILVYQGLRAGLTWLVGRMSDDDAQNGYSPAYRPDPVPIPSAWWDRMKYVHEITGKYLRAYGWLYPVHRFTKILFVIAIASFTYNLVYWVTRPVWLF